MFEAFRQILFTVNEKPLGLLSHIQSEIEILEKQIVWKNGVDVWEKHYES